LVVLLGTLLPLVHKELGMGSISIGAPFFNQMFVFLIVPFVLMLGIGPLSRWKQQAPQALLKQLVIAFALALTAAVLIQQAYDQMRYMATLGLVLSVWILVTTVQEVLQRTENRSADSSSFMARLTSLTPSHWGMVLGHVGFAVTLIGITLVSNFEQEKDVRMHIGDRTEVAGYEFVFTAVKPLQGPNYNGYTGHVDVYQGQNKVASLDPQKRFYPVQRNTMTEAGIDSGISRDLFVAMGEQLSDGAWALRLYVKPFVNWIWFGAAIMALGGVCSMADRRYRLAKVAKVKSVLKGRDSEQEVSA
jgi:cytochrome c-type biogenesis protein CcmF